MTSPGQPLSLPPLSLPQPSAAPSLSPEAEREHRFIGYAALFDRVDRAGDVFRAGAFAGSDTVPLLRNHRGPAIGSVRVREDARGLVVEGTVAGVRVGDGLSVGYRATRTRQGARRELLSVRLVEVSLVAIPMQPGARVTAVG